MKKIPVFFPILLITLLFITGCGKQKKSISTLSDLKNIKIGAMTGSTGEQLALKKFPQAETQRFDDIMDAVAALKSGQIDAVITALPTCVNICKHNKDIVTLPEEVEKEYCAAAMKKEDTKLLEDINKAIAEMKSDGTLDDMRKRWVKTESTPYVTAEIQLPKTGKPLKVGTAATREPVAFVDEKNQVSGHDGELARRIAAKLNRPVEFYDMKFAALIPALKSGKVDVIFSGMTATEERKKSINFSDPYFESGQLILVKRQASEGSSGLQMSVLDDIKDKSVGVFTGTIFDAFVANKYPNAKIQRYASTSDMLLSLKTGKVDAAFFDRITAHVAVKTNPELGILDDDALSTPLGYGFNKNNPDLRQKFNAFLKEAKSNGVFDTVYKRWFVNDPEKAEMPKPTVFPGAPKITLGASVNDLPYVAVVKGEYVGFDIELLQEFAKHEKMNLNIITMEFSSLIAALASGKVDIIADGISITEERKKQVDFSDAYTDFHAAVLALNKNLAGSNGGGEAKQSVSFFKSVSNSFYNNIIVENRYLLIWDGLKVTLNISLLATIFGTLLGALICFMRMSKRKLLSVIAKVYISLLRGTPVLVLLMIIFYIVFASVNIDPVFVAVVAFGMNFAAYVSEMFRTGIEGVERGQTEAGIAIGFTKIKTFLYIVMPQAAKRILPVYKGELISMVKMTSVVGYIAVQDLTKASDIIRSRTFDAFFPLIMVAALYFLLSWLLMVAIGYLEKLTYQKSKAKRSN